MNYFIEVPPPSCDFVFVTPCVEGSRDRVLFAACGDLPLDLSHGSAIKTLVSRLLCVRTGGSNSRGQFPNRLEHGPAEFV
jgi:hypothetical protein